MLWEIDGNFLWNKHAVGVIAIAYDGDMKEFRIIGTLTIGPNIINIQSQHTWPTVGDATKAVISGNHLKDTDIGCGQSWDITFVEHNMGVVPND